MRLFSVFCCALIMIPFRVALGEDQADPIIGLWETLDDETGEPEAIVQTYLDQEKLYGKIVKIFVEEGEDPDPVCDKCSGDRKNQKIVGMVIIDGLENKGDKWSGGKILDPENGKSYKCKLWLEGDGLQVRGTLLFFHRTQTWYRFIEEQIPDTGPTDMDTAEDRAIREDL